MKQYYCNYCPKRPRSIHEFVRHEASHHLCQPRWSCATFGNPEDVIFIGSDETAFCDYCEMRFQDYCEEEDFVLHLANDHNFGGCDKRFDRAEDFLEHLEHYHKVVPDTWTDELENACSKGKATPSNGAGATSVDATQAPYALQSADASTMRLSAPQAQDDVPPPLRPPICFPHTSTTPESDGRSVNHFDIAGHGDFAAIRPGSRIPDEELKSLNLMDVASEKSVTRKRRMSSPVSESAKNSPRAFPATLACIPAAAVRSSATEDCTKSPASPQRSTASRKKKSEPKHVCSICQRSYTRHATLVNHERTHTGEKPFSCTFEGCNQTFAQQGDKTRHEKAQHAENTFICGSSNSEGPSWGCGKAYPRKDGLLEHHRKTKKGKQCLADRDKLVELGRIGDEESPGFP